ncbi:MAG: HD domain-containing protein [Eubacteriales bacterium]|nr:HD domain-containing protein [Eubacteriales bacterium]
MTKEHTAEEDERLQRQIAFCQEIDKEKFILRQTRLTGGTQREDDAQHAWHMAIMTMILSEYASQPINVLHTISMLLIHDLVEIDAGDTFAYDEEGKKTQRQREEKAADRIFGLLPEDQRDRLRALWEEFEEGRTPEALFAHTMDNFQPAMLNALTHGKMWKEKGVRLSQILERNEATGKGSKTLWDYSLEHFIMSHVAAGKVIDDTRTGCSDDKKDKGENEL